VYLTANKWLTTEQSRTSKNDAVKQLSSATKQPVSRSSGYGKKPMKNTPHSDLDELTISELIFVAQQVAADLLAAGHTPDDLLECDVYRELERYVDDRLYVLRNRETRSLNDRSESTPNPASRGAILRRQSKDCLTSRVVIPVLRFLKESYLQHHAKITRSRD